MLTDKSPQCIKTKQTDKKPQQQKTTLPGKGEVSLTPEEGHTGSDLSHF